MEKPFEIKSLIDNGIKVERTPNLSRQSITLLFEDGEKYELSKSAALINEQSNYIWDDDVALQKSELQYFGYESSRGNPLLYLEKVAYMSQIDAELDDIINFYNGEQ